MNLKQFKLIKQFPINPYPLGTIYQESETDPCDFIPQVIGKRNSISLKEIKKFPEHFEEIIIEFEVLILNNINVQYGNIKACWYGGGDEPFKENFSKIKHIYPTNAVWYTHFLNNPDWEIYSVKRLSDGQVFTIGDSLEESCICHKSNAPMNISKIGIVKDPYLEVVHSIFDYTKKGQLMLAAGNNTHYYNVTLKDAIKAIPLDYQITAFYDKNPKRISTLRDSGQYLIDGNFEFPKEAYLTNTAKNNGWKIYSVKRLKDGEEFTIGDRLDSKGIIDDITINEGYDSGICIKAGHTTTSINWSYKSKPIATSEDGVALYEGDKFISVNANTKYDGTDLFEKPYQIRSVNCILKLNHDQESSRKNNVLWFSTVEAANKWLAINKPKPIITTKDGVDKFIGDTVVIVDKHFNILSLSEKIGIFSLQMQVISAKNGVVWFSTLAKAQNYIFNNKPLISLNDVKKYNSHMESVVVDELSDKIRDILQFKTPDEK